MHIVRARRVRHLPAERTDARPLPVPPLPLLFLVLRQMRVRVQIQVRLRLESLRTNATHKVPRLDVHAVVVPETSLLGKAPSAFVTHVRQVVRVDVFGVRFQALLGGVFFITLAALELADAGVLHCVVRKARLSRERLWAELARETLLAMDRPYVGVHQRRSLELFAASFANRRAESGAFS